MCNFRMSQEDFGQDCSRELKKVYLIIFCTCRSVIDSSLLVISSDRINLSVCMSNIIHHAGIQLELSVISYIRS